MAATERREIQLEGGGRLHQLSYEDRLFGFISIEADGRARVWEQTWLDRWRPTDTVFPGFISAARAVIRGEV